MVMEEHKDENDKVISRQPYKPHEYVISDAKSYIPEMQDAYNT